MNPIVPKALRAATLAAGLALFAPCAPSATFVYNEMDLILGFGSPTAANEYVINLGQVSSLTTGPLSLGNVNADLTAQFGSSWFNRNDLFWGAFAASYDDIVGSDPQYTIYATKRTGLAALTRASVSQQAIRASNVDSVGNVLNGDATTANSSFGVVQDKASANSYSSKQNASHSQMLSAYSFAEGTFSNGSSNATLDLYRLAPTPPSGAGTKMGSLSINDSGQITYTELTAIPEPSTWALLGFGALAALAARARRRPSA